MASKSLASTLYRAILSSAKRYGEGAQKRCLPAKKEMEGFNSVMKSLQLPIPTSGIMNSQIATHAVQSVFRSQPEAQEAAYMADAFAVLRKLRQKEIVLNRFPNQTFSDCTTDGCKIESKSRYLWERANGWHFWDYTVKITNNTERSLQLFTEKLRTTDENLNERNLEFALIASLKTLPVIKPGEQYEFTKRMMFRTKCGSLSGSYMLIDTEKGEALHAKMSPILLTANVDEEILNSMQATLNTADDEEKNKFETKKRSDGARMRRLRREEEEREKKESEGVLEKTEIPDSDLKSQIRRGLSRSRSLSFSKPPKNSSSSRKRAIQRATPVATPQKQRGEQEGEQSEIEESPSAPTQLEPEGGHK
jgi:uncharacterized protein affecting Mg2+/Co2+ transport